MQSETTDERMGEIFDQVLSRKPTDLRRHERYIAYYAQRKLLSPPLVPPYKPTKSHMFEVVDLFCGSGGMSLGFSALSRAIPFFEVVGGCDIDENAADSFETNLAAPVVRQNVRSLRRGGNLRAFEKAVGRDKSKPLVVVGGAPCQGFSSHRKRYWHIRDSRNTLVTTFAKVAVDLKPACIVMENVPELLSRRYWNHFREARHIFRKAGFVVHQRIYNAASFGVPQHRFRAIIIAKKRDFLMPEPMIWNSDDYSTVRDAIADLPPVGPGEVGVDPMHVCARHRKDTLRVISAVAMDGGSRPPGVGPKCLDKVKGFYDVYGRLQWDRPAITITHYARNPASGRFVHPEQHRGLTMREAARLQSFPDWFRFMGPFDSVFKQIGEAVPPKFAAAIAANVLVELVSPSPDPGVPTASQDVGTPVTSSYSSLLASMKRVRM